MTNSVQIWSVEAIALAGKSMVVIAELVNFCFCFVLVLYMTDMQNSEGTILVPQWCTFKFLMEFKIHSSQYKHKILSLGFTIMLLWNQFDTKGALLMFENWS